MLSNSPPRKSQGINRSFYHNRNSPYSARGPQPSSVGPRDSSRDNSRHHQQKTLERGENSKAECDAPERRRDSDVASKIGRERKFNGRCRIFVGNVPNDMKEDELKKLFEPFGETDEVYLSSSRGFGFIKLETRYKAEEACLALDGHAMKNGHNLRVKITCHNAALRVKYLPRHVSNEILANTFSMFGEVERAVVVVDDKGKSTGEGIVEFTKKPSALNALNRINDGVFLINGNSKPILVELAEPIDDWNGLPDYWIIKSQDLNKDREKPTSFAQEGSIEYEIGKKWKEHFKMAKDQREMAARIIAEDEAKVQAYQENMFMEQHTLLLSQDIQRRHEEVRMLEQAHNEMQRKIEMRSRMPLNSSMNMERHQPDDLRGRGRGPQMMDADMRRRQMDAPNNNNNYSSAESFFNVELGGPERPSLSLPLQPPPVPPPGIERARMGGMNLPGGPGGAALSGLNNNNNNSGPRNIRMEMFHRPVMPQHMNSAPQLRPQVMRFDATQGLRPGGGNMFGVRPQGHGLMQGHSGSHGPVDHDDPKRARRI